MFPQLTNGVIKRILDGKDVANPVMQILRYKTISEAGNDHYRLLISDGVNGFPFAMLATQLNQMVTNKELQKFTIVRVDKCVCKQVQADQKVIILFSLTVLVPGNEVNKTLGNPVPLPTTDEAARATTNTPCENETPIQITADFPNTFPQLTTGAINRILNGENVVNSVMQILGCKTISEAGNDRYRLIISDGVTGFPFAMLATQLNQMVTNKELQKLTIVRVDKCVCNQVQADRKVIILLSLTVLVPGNEVNEKFGNPVNSSTGGASTKASSNRAYLNSRQRQREAYFHIIFPQLTPGAISRILNGVTTENSVVQILGCKKLFGNENDRYRLLISDGVAGWPFAMLGTQLNHMVENNQLEKFTVVRLDKSVCNQTEGDCQVIILLGLTVLIPGNEIDAKLGNPVNYPDGGASIGATSIGLDLNAADFLIMFPQLSAGALKRILNGEDSKNAIMQTLGYKKMPQSGADRYRLIISDGIAQSTFTILAPKLNYMLANKELEEFTIVRVDKCVCNQQANPKLITLMGLTVLVPGNKVNKKLGNPVCSYTKGGAISKVPEVNDRPIPKAADMLNMLSQLTAGAINLMLKVENTANAVVQTLGYEKIPEPEDDYYRLIISDGIAYSAEAVLLPNLNHMIANKELEEFTIVRVEKCLCNQQVRPKLMILIGLTVLVPGNKVKKKLGNPVRLFTKDAVTAKPPEINDNPKLAKLLSRLTAGALNRILDGENVVNAVVQIVGCKKLPYTRDDNYHLVIFDGLSSWPFAVLGTQLDHMAANKELEAATIVQIDEFVLSRGNGSVRIILNKLTVLVPGNEFNAKLENCS